MTIRGPSPVAANVRYPAARWTVKFYLQDGQYQESASREGILVDSDDLIRGSTYKHVKNPIGTYSLTLVPQKDYFNILTPGDWCEILSDNEDGLGQRVLMYGPITAIKRNRVVNERGATTTTITVVGADFGKAIATTTSLLDEKLASDPGFASLGWVYGAIGGLDIGQGLNPARVVKHLLQRYHGANIPQCTDPKTGTVFGAGLSYDYLDSNTIGEAIFKPIVMSTPLWQLLQQWANLALNEMFVDYRPVVETGFSDNQLVSQENLVNLVPAVILRQHPFWGQPWDQLTAVEVKMTEVISEALEKTDTDVVNWIRVIDEPSVTGSNISISTHTEGIGLLNSDSIERFGIKRFEPTSAFVFDTSAQNNNQPPRTLPGILEEMTGFCSLWHHSNERLEQGTITLYHRPDIRIGYRLDYIDEEAQDTGDIKEFYIEGVQHEYDYPRKSTTTLTVTRGRKRNDPLFRYGLEELRDQGVLQSMGTTLSRAIDAVAAQLGGG